MQTEAEAALTADTEATLVALPTELQVALLRHCADLDSASALS